MIVMVFAEQRKRSTLSATGPSTTLVFSHSESVLGVLRPYASVQFPITLQALELQLRRLECFQLF